MLLLATVHTRQAPDKFSHLWIMSVIVIKNAFNWVQQVISTGSYTEFKHFQKETEAEIRLSASMRGSAWHTVNVAIRGSMHTPFADARLPPIFCDPITTSYRICFVHVWNVTSKWTPEGRLDRTCPWRLQLSIYASVWEYNPDLRVDTVMQLAAAWATAVLWPKGQHANIYF